MAAIRALAALPSHFWLDETATVWVASGGMARLVSPSSFARSFLYEWLIMGLRSLCGNREWALRLPSFFAIALAAATLFRMARRIWGPGTAWLALALFVSIPSVRFAAGDARPYGLGLLFVILSTELLLMLLERPNYRLAAGYAVTAGLVPHFQLLFSAAVAAQALYAAYQFVRGRRIAAKYAGIAAMGCLLVAAPVAEEVWALARDPKLHVFTVVPSLDQVTGVFLNALLPLQVGVCVAAGLVWAAASRWRVQWKLGRGRDEVVLVVLAAVTPPAALLAASLIGRANIFVGRYLLSDAGGLALCFGVFAGALRPARAARIVALALVGCQFYGFAHELASGARHTRDLGDWSSAVAYMDANTARDGAPALIRSQYMESDRAPLTPVTDNPMFSQLTCYPSKSHLTGIGASFSERQARDIDKFLDDDIGKARRFLVVAVDSPRSLAPLRAYLAGRLGPGSHSSVLANFDGVQVIEYELGK
jgi:hypothetical protein